MIRSGSRDRSWDMMFTGRKAEFEPPTVKQDFRRRKAHATSQIIDARQDGTISQQVRAQTTRLNLRADIER